MPEFQELTPEQQEKVLSYQKWVRETASEFYRFLQYADIDLNRYAWDEEIEALMASLPQDEPLPITGSFPGCSAITPEDIAGLSELWFGVFSLGPDDFYALIGNDPR